jgi:hypothetical protein
MLVDHPYTEGDGISRRSKVDRLALNAHHTGVGLHHPVRDAHEGSLPRSVLAEQSVHRASPNDKVRIA